LHSHQQWVRTPIFANICGNLHVAWDCISG
jgi:hypothetical protein